MDADASGERQRRLPEHVADALHALHPALVAQRQRVVDVPLGVLPPLSERDSEQEPFEGAEVEALHAQPKRVVHVPHQLRDELRP